MLSKPAKLLDHDYTLDYDLQCITTIDELKSTLDKYKEPEGTYTIMGFDTETTGLNPEEDSIVGYSFAFDDKSGYYVPVNHLNLALGDEALDLIYDAMLKTKLVLMFNSRFDIRMMEWDHFEDEPLSFKEEFIRKCRMLYSKYDMSKIKIYDIQVMVLNEVYKKLRIAPV